MRKTAFPSDDKRLVDTEPPKQARLKMAILFFGAIAIGGYFLWSREPEETVTETLVSPVEAQEEIPPPESKERVVSYIVAPGDLPAEVFFEYGKLDPNEIRALLEATKDVYDFTNIRIGRELQFFFSEQETAEKMRYYASTETMIEVEYEDGVFSARKEAIPYEVTEELTHVKIDEFLYKDGLDAGLSEASILEIADIFSFDIDFTTEIREGDEMRVLYERRVLNGKQAPDGKIIAASFTNAGTTYFGYYFESEVASGHYDSEGNELARQFLRAPLSYRAITSGYTGARLHPITKQVTAHYQIDYAAPTGTPVVATARGTVVSARLEGGWGNIVRLQHDNGYTTHYAHLSGYAKGLAAGPAVSQGQIIGYVGSTGWSTGPHLDYGMRLKGSPVNPLSLTLPKGASLTGDEKDRFQAVRQKLDERLR